MQTGKTVTTGVVLRVTDTKETDRILTVLTADMGKIPLIARGARRKNSRLAASCQMPAYSEMTLYRRGNWYFLDEAAPVEVFDGLGRDIELLALAAWFCELTEAVCAEETPCPEVLSLLLNGLYALCYSGKNSQLIKAAFQFRLMALSGFEALAEGCAVCGEPHIKVPVLDVYGGFIACNTCKSAGGGLRLPLTEGALAALRHVLYGEAKRLYSFTLDEESLRSLDQAGEAFIAAQLERSFRTLDYYKSLSGASFLRGQQRGKSGQQRKTAGQQQETAETDAE